MIIWYHIMVLYYVLFNKGHLGINVCNKYTMLWANLIIYICARGYQHVLLIVLKFTKVFKSSGKSQNDAYNTCEHKHTKQSNIYVLIHMIEHNFNFHYSMMTPKHILLLFKVTQVIHVCTLTEHWDMETVAVPLWAHIE